MCHDSLSLFIYKLDILNILRKKDHSDQILSSCNIKFLWFFVTLFWKVMKYYYESQPVQAVHWPQKQSLCKVLCYGCL